MSTVGFIGLGNMGSGMVKNLLTAGFDVVGSDVDSDKAANLEQFGMKKAGVAEIAQTCSVVILCLPNPNASEDVIFNQLLGGKNSPTTIIETSTITPEIVTDFAEKLDGENIQFLCTPMVGGKNHAADGEIDFLVEGGKATYESSLDIFNAMGKARFMGKVPSATLAKLTFNLCRYSNLAVAVEAYRLLKQYDANTTAIHEFMSEQSLDNFGQVWAEDMKEMMTQDIPYEPSKVPKKDLTLLSEMAQTQGIDQALINAVRDTYQSME